MSTPKGEFYRKAIERALMCRTSNTPNAGVVAEATLNLWQQMAAGLAPIIGARGVDVLFGRSLHLTSRAFPRLVITGDPGDNDALLASLKAHLAECDTNDALESSYALLGTFTELLSTLIGESLTGRLLHPVWELPSPRNEREIES
jgi:hypothetical protein